MTPFFTILTNYGKTVVAEALATLQPLEIPYMAAGDSGGEYYDPTEVQTNLRNELWRGELNDLSIDESAQDQVIAESIISAGVNGEGWTVREIGLFDKKGGLVAIGKHPEVYISSLLSGAQTQAYIRIIIKIDNVSAVQLTVDHGQAIASKQFVLNKGYGIIGSFEDGLTYADQITSPFQLIHSAKESALYFWTGKLPKLVNAGSTPETEGGIGHGKWRNVADYSLRNDIFSGDGSLIGTGKGRNLKEDLGLINQDIKKVEAQNLNPASPRNVIQYRGAKSVNVLGNHFPMGGFRFLGQYYKTKVPTFTSKQFINPVDLTKNMAFGMGVELNQWYAVFAVANVNVDSLDFVIVPYLRVDAHPVDNVVSLRIAGFNIPTSQPVSYSWNVNNVVGSDVLVISERIGVRANAFSGRVAQITDCTAQTVTLDNIGMISENDWLLPAPTRQYQYYRYCGSFYHDTAEIFNIADSGTLVKQRGVYDHSVSGKGVVTTLQKRNVSGFISPLASSVCIQSQGELKDNSTGQFTENFAIDSAHVVSVFDFNKTLTASAKFVSGEITIPFMFGQQYFYQNSGALAETRDKGQQNLWGWCEL